LQDGPDGNATRSGRANASGMKLEKVTVEQSGPVARG